MAEELDLAGLVGADLNHGNFMVIRQRKQRQRCADLVVVVRCGLQHPHRRREYVGHKVLRRGLSGSTGDGDHRNRKPTSVIPPEGTQCMQCGCAGDRRGGRGHACGVLGKDKASPLADGLVDVVVSVEAFSSQRNKGVTRHDRARVGADAPHNEVGREHLGGRTEHGEQVGVVKRGRIGHAE